MPTIRRLVPGDEAIACDVANHVKDEVLADTRFVDVAFMTRFLADDRNYLVAACEDSTPIGFALGYSLPRIDKDKAMMYMHELGVLESRRGEGIGKGLVDEMVRICRTEGFMEMFVITARDNTSAVKVYESAGGSAIEESDVVYCYDFEDDD